MRGRGGGAVIHPLVARCEDDKGEEMEHDEREGKGKKHAFEALTKKIKVEKEWCVCVCVEIRKQTSGEDERGQCGSCWRLIVERFKDKECQIDEEQQELRGR